MSSVRLLYTLPVRLFLPSHVKLSYEGCQPSAVGHRGQDGGQSPSLQPASSSFDLGVDRNEARIKKFQ